MQAFRTFVHRQPEDVPFIFAYKGKYIVQITKSTEGTAHVNAYYYVDNSQNLVDHDFEAGVPAAGQLTIEKTSHVTPGSTAAFQAELTAFLQSLGLGNLNIQGGRAFNWYDAVAAYYEAPVYHIVNTQDDDNEDCLTLADQFGNIVVPVLSTGGVVGGHLYAQDGRIASLTLPDGAACPVPDSVIANALSTEGFPVDVITANYSVVKGNCSVDGQVAINLVPQNSAYPVIKGLGQFVSGDPDQLTMIFSIGDIVVLQMAQYPSVEEMAQGEKHYVMLNDSPCCLQQTDQQNMNLEILGSDSTHIKGYPTMARGGNYYYSEDEYETTAAEVGYTDWINEGLGFYQCEVHVIYNDDPSLEKATGVFEI